MSEGYDPDDRSFMLPSVAPFFHSCLQFVRIDRRLSTRLDIGSKSQFSGQLPIVPLSDVIFALGSEASIIMSIFFSAPPFILASSTESTMGPKIEKIDALNDQCMDEPKA